MNRNNQPIELNPKEQEIKEALQLVQTPSWDPSEQVFATLAAGHRSASKVRKKKHVLILVALLLLSLSTVFAAVSSSYEQFMSGIQTPFEEVLKPIELVCEDQGIRMEVVAAGVYDGLARIYVTFQDLTGDRLAEGLDFRETERHGFIYGKENNRMSWQRGHGSGRQVLDYDWEQKKLTYYYEFYAGDRDTQAILMSYDILYYNANLRSGHPLGLEAEALPVLDSVQDSALLNFQEIVEYPPGWGELPREEWEKFATVAIPLLKPDREGALIDGVQVSRLTGAAIIDGQLHIQLWRDLDNFQSYGTAQLWDGAEKIQPYHVSYFSIDEDTRETTTLYEKVQEEMPDGSVMEYSQSLPPCYAEYIFDVDTSRLADYTITGFFQEYEMINGLWELEVSTDGERHTRVISCEAEVFDGVTISEISISPFGVALQAVSDRETYNNFSAHLGDRDDYVQLADSELVTSLWKTQLGGQDDWQPDEPDRFIIEIRAESEVPLDPEAAEYVIVDGVRIDL